MMPCPFRSGHLEAEGRSWYLWSMSSAWACRPFIAASAMWGLGVHSSASWALKCRRLLAFFGEHGGVLPLRSFRVRCFLAPVRRNGDKRPYSLSSPVSGKASGRLDGDQGPDLEFQFCSERSLSNGDLVTSPPVNG
jgi:hypothetical protein